MNLAAQYDAITRCPQCEAKLRASSSWFGELLECPKCVCTFAFQLITSGVTGDTAKLKSPSTVDSNSDVEPSPPPLRSSRAADVPRRLGRYLPRRCLGQGGFGVVYLASDPTLQRDVAIKLPNIGRDHGGSESDQQIRQRFIKEARAAARLRHPNIVAVFDHGQTDEGVYIVYEFVPGETLEDRIAAKSIGLEDAVRLTATLADALSYAASEAIVHRDIKPANIMIDGHGRPQIMDFGLAVALHQGKASTRGKIAGTPAYMSPEQARGEGQIGPASDQYSLCSILYEMVTGARAVNASGVAALAEVAQRETPPLGPLASVPKDLRAILLRGMNRDPADRYQDSSMLAADLRAYLAGFPVSANPVGVPRRVQKWAQRNTATAAATVAIAFLLVAIAVVSAFSAVQLQRRGRALADALTEARAARAAAEEQTRIAQSQTAEAQDQRMEAEKQKQEAEFQKEIAQASQKRAEEALQRERIERDKRAAAESLAETESQRRLDAVAAADLAKSELENVSEEKRALLYSEWLTQAAAEIVRDDLSAARETLQRCSDQDRGWEWRWLNQNAIATREFRRLPQVPVEVRQYLQPPPALAGRVGFQTYDANLLGPKAPLEWEFRPIVVGRNQRIGAVIQEVEVKRTKGSPSGQQPFLRYLRKIDLQAGTFQDVCDAVEISSGVHLLGDGAHASIVTGGPSPQPRFAEVWSLGAEPFRVLQIPIDSWWVPSFEFNAETNNVFGAVSPNRLSTWDAEDGSERHAADLSFFLATGPRSISQLQDGRLALIDAEHRVHYVHPYLGEVDSGAKWELREELRGKTLWDSSGRYLAYFSPGGMTERKVAPGQFQPMPSRNWHVIDVAESRSHFTAEMPMSDAKEVVIEEPTGEGRGRTREYTAIAAKALDILQFEVDQNGDRISARDSFGGMWCWQREADIGSVETRFQLPVPIKLAVRDGAALVGTDGIKLVYFLLDEPTVYPRKIRRSHGGELLDVAIDEVSQRIATVDEDGFVTVYNQGRESWQTRIPSASKSVFASLGSVLFVATSQGDLHLLDVDQEGKVVQRERAHPSAVEHLIALPNLGMVASAGTNRSIRFWDVTTGLRVDIPETLMTAPISELLYDAAGQRLIVFTQSDVVSFQCSATGIERLDSMVIPHRVEHATLIDAGRRILACGGRNASILDAESARTVYSLPQTIEEISTLYADDGDPWILLSNGLSRHLRTRD